MSELSVTQLRSKTHGRKQTMRAAVICKPQTIEIKEMALPMPATGYVRVKLEGCGICASNLPVWQGRDWFTYPCEPGGPGHEGWGVIDETGEGVLNFQKSDRVAFIGSHSYAEYESVAADSLVLIPEVLKYIPLPGEPFACAMNIFKRSGIKQDQRVAIVGIGFIGAMLVQLAASSGAEVIAISRRPFALSTAKKCGAHHVIAMDDHYKIIEKVKNLTYQKGCEVVIESTGLQWPIDLASELTAVRGRLVIAGYHQEPRQINMQLWNWRGLDVINAHERDPQVYINGMKNAMAAMESGYFKPYQLLTNKYSLEELPKAFEDMQTRPEGFLKGYIEF